MRMIAAILVVLLVTVGSAFATPTPTATVTPTAVNTPNCPLGKGGECFMAAPPSFGNAVKVCPAGDPNGHYPLACQWTPLPTPGGASTPIGCGSVAPTVASCGTSPVQPANSTNCDFTFTTGTASPTGCTVTFATSAISGLTGVPICLFQDNHAIGGTVIIYDVPTNAPSATDVLTFSAAATSHQIKGHCGWVN